MAAMDVNENKEQELHKRSSLGQPPTKQSDLDYSKLDVTSLEDQKILTLHTGNYDIDRMNWKQIEYDALYEGSIISTHELIEKWIQKNESNSNANANSNTNTNTNTKKDTNTQTNTDSNEYSKYLEIRHANARVIDWIARQYDYCMLAYAQLQDNHTNSNNKDKSDSKNSSESKNETDAEWITQVDNYDGISIYYRKEENTPIHSIKATFQCKCSPLEFLACINEFDLLSEVITIVPIECRLLYEPSDVDKVLYCKLNMWWPLQNRDVICEVFAYNCLYEHNCIIIAGQTVDVNNESETTQKNDKNDKNDKNKNENDGNKESKTKDEEDTDLNEEEMAAKSSSRLRTEPPKKRASAVMEAHDAARLKKLQQVVPKVPKRTVRMDVKWGLGSITPIVYDSNDSKKCVTEINAIFNVDFKSFLPTNLLNWVTRTFAFYACKMVRNKGENIYASKKHMKRMNEKEVYQRIVRQLKVWNEEKAKQQPNEKTNAKTMNLDPK